MKKNAENPGKFDFSNEDPKRKAYPTQEMVDFVFARLGKYADNFSPPLLYPHFAPGGYPSFGIGFYELNVDEGEKTWENAWNYLINWIDNYVDSRELADNKVGDVQSDIHKDASDPEAMEEPVKFVVIETPDLIPENISRFEKYAGQPWGYKIEVKEDKPGEDFGFIILQVFHDQFLYFTANEDFSPKEAKKAAESLAEKLSEPKTQRHIRKLYKKEREIEEEYDAKLKILKKKRKDYEDKLLS